MYKIHGKSDPFFIYFILYGNIPLIVSLHSCSPLSNTSWLQDLKQAKPAVCVSAQLQTFISNVYISKCIIIVCTVKVGKQVRRCHGVRFWTMTCLMGCKHYLKPNVTSVELLLVEDIINICSID